MAELNEIVTYLDQNLRTEEIPDYQGAQNGLQLENSGKVEKVAVAVDASLPVIKKAVDTGAHLLIVHHGMFWQGVRPLTGAFYEKIKLAMDADLAIYSSHIPLDVHDKWGNNVLLAKELGMSETKPFFDWKGIKLGLSQELNLDFGEFVKRVEHAVGKKVHFCQGGGNFVGRVGVITGGAGGEVELVSKEGIDTFLTGEGQHWTYPLAQELGVNLIYAGHYATEVFGVRCLGAVIEESYEVQVSFVDEPTGL